MECALGAEIVKSAAVLRDGGIYMLYGEKSA